MTTRDAFFSSCAKKFSRKLGMGGEESQLEVSSSPISAKRRQPARARHLLRCRNAPPSHEAGGSVAANNLPNSRRRCAAGIPDTSGERHLRGSSPCEP